MNITLRPILDNVLFQFEDELATAGGIKQFRETTAWGFDLRSSFDHNVKQPRWVRVVAVGPDVSEAVQPGMRVLVEPLKWTDGLPLEDQIYWSTKEEHVLAVDDN